MMRLQYFCPLAFVFTLFHFWPLTNAHVDIFLSKEEVKKLLGLDTQIYYVRDGAVNSYALQFKVPVAENINQLAFNWVSRNGAPIAYSIAFYAAGKEGILPPTLSIDAQGVIPSVNSVFTVDVQCTGKLSTEIPVLIQLNYTWPSEHNQTSLLFHRKKTCIVKKSELYSDNAPPTGNNRAEESEGALAVLKSIHGTRNRNEGQLSEDVVDDKYGLPNENDKMETIGTKKFGHSNPSVNTRTTHIFYIAIGCISAFILIIASMVSVYFLRNRPKQPSLNRLGQDRTEQRHYMSAFSSPAFGAQRQPFLRPETPSSKYSGYTSGVSTSVASSGVPRSRCSPAPSCVLPAEPREIDQALALAKLSAHKGGLEFGQLLLAGTFGEIYFGLFTKSVEANIERRSVLIKTVKCHTAASQVQKFQEECLLFYGLPPHQNVMQVLYASKAKSANGSPSEGDHLPAAASADAPNCAGLISNDHNSSSPFPLLFAFSHPLHGNLKEFLLSSRGATANLSHSLSTQDLVFMAIQIVHGMCHLHRYRLIHKDLATRNCWIDDGLRVQIADYSLSRDLFPGDYQCLGDNENRPVKWLAIESLIARQFSSASDVWSFGVTLWEIMTLGLQPYNEVDPFEMAAYLTDGYRLQQPYNCPDELYGVIYCCWALNVEARPNFLQLQTALQDFYNALMSFV